MSNRRRVNRAPTNEERAIYREAEASHWDVARATAPREGVVFYKHEFADQAFKLRLLGLNDQELGEFFGVSTVVIIAWRHRFPAFREAWEAGAARADAEVAHSYYKRAVGYDAPAERIFCTKEGDVVRADTFTHVPGDPTAARAWLAARRPDMWTIRTTLDVDVSATDRRERNVRLIEAVALRELPAGGSAD